jgi:predicted outer membrane repeat protein
MFGTRRPTVAPIVVFFSIAVVLTATVVAAAQTPTERAPDVVRQGVAAEQPANPEAAIWAAVEVAYHEGDWEAVKALLKQLPTRRHGERIQLLLSELPRERPTFDDVAPLTAGQELFMMQQDTAVRLSLEAQAGSLSAAPRIIDASGDPALPPRPSRPAKASRAPIPPPTAPSDIEAPTATLKVGAACTYANLQAAVDAATSGDTIWIQGTTWTGALATVNISNKTLYIWGGLNPACTALDGSQTTLDATGVADSVLEISLTAGQLVQLHHFDLTGGTPDLDNGGGLEIDGEGTVELYDTKVFGNDSALGGGVHMDDAGSSLVLDDVSRIHSNTADNHGGGIYCENGSITLTGGSDIGVNGGNIADHDADGTGNGGGVYLDACTLTLNGQDGTFIDVVDNQAVNGGGVYAVNNSYVAIQDESASVRSNSAGQNGGGLYLASGADVYVDSGHVNDNSAGSSGGGVYVNGSDSYVDFDNFYCTTLPCASLDDNDAGSAGGAIYATGSATVDLESTSVDGNQAGAAGSAIYASGSGTTIGIDTTMITDSFGGPGTSYAVRLFSSAQATINNTTFAGNSDTDEAVFGIHSGAGMSAYGLIVWGNDSAAIVHGDGIATIECSVLQSAFTGADNVVADPEFLNEAGGNYHISRSSPALDMCSGANGTIEDIDNEARPNDVLGGSNTYDAGADEAYVFVGRNGAACGYGSITDAIAAASAGDTIHIPAGIYVERLGVVAKDLTLTSSSNDCTTEVDQGIYGVTIDANDAAATWGGVIDVSSSATVTLRNLHLRDGTATYGGLVYVTGGSTLVLDDTQLAYGSATAFGGAIRNNGTTEMINGSFIFSSEATGSGEGGAVAISSGQFNLRGSSTIGYCGSGFTNTSANNGGGVYIASGSLNLHETSQVCNNAAATRGGGVFATSTATVTMHGSSRIGAAGSTAGNSAPTGAGASLEGTAALTMEDSSTVRHNSATSHGGGVALAGNSTLMMDGASVGVLDNTADFWGGGLFISDNDGGNNPAATIQSGARVADNTATVGGGIYIEWDGASVTATDAEITNNTAASQGGGINAYNSTTLILERVTVTDNEATAGDGGGIALNTGIGGSPDLDLIDCIVDSNVAANNGGGIYNQGGVLDLEAETSPASVSGNTAGGSGGGIYDGGGNSLKVWANSGFPFTIDGNTATTDGGGIFTTNGVYHNVYGDVRITNNTAGNDGGGVYQDGGDGWYDDLTSASRPQISGNEATSGNGGGFYLSFVVDTGAPLFDGVLIDGNSAPNAAGNGGGIYATASSFAMNTVSVQGNSAGQTGGGLFADSATLVSVSTTFGTPTKDGVVGHPEKQRAAACNPASLPADTYCTEFRDNLATTTGGAVHLRGGSTLTADAVAFIGNHADLGGAIFSNSNGDAVDISNSLFAGNIADAVSGSVIRLLAAGTLDLESTTIAGNPATALSFGTSGATAQIDGTVIWDNTSGVFLNGVVPTGSCNDTQDGSLAGIQQDPLFTTTARGSYRLSNASPAVDACNTGPAIDLDNSSRPKDGDGAASAAEYDMGAFETGELPPEIFSDDFESGNTSEWSSSTP